MSQLSHSGQAAHGAFAVLGLSPAEDAAYRQLTSLRSATARDLRERLGLSPAEARRVFAELERRGMVSWTAGTPRRLVAAPPSAAVDVLALEVERQLQRARVEAARLAVDWSAGTSPKEADELVEVITGEQAILRRFESMIRSARQEIIGFAVAPIVAPEDINMSINIDALKRGVRLRTIYEQAVLDSPAGFVKVVAECEAAGEQVRILDHLPTKMVIADRLTALLPVNLQVPDATPSAALIHAPLASTLTALFEELWRRATPAVLSGQPSAGPHGISPADLKLLSLILGGMSDDSVARHLGISRRTVHRHIDRMIRLAGVQTRLQLLWRAGEAGWLTRPPTTRLPIMVGVVRRGTAGYP